MRVILNNVKHSVFSYKHVVRKQTSFFKLKTSIESNIYLLCGSIILIQDFITTNICNKKGGVLRVNIVQD